MSWKSLSACLSALALLAAAPPAWGITGISSAWRTAPITIDGSDADWNGTLTRIQEWRADVGIANDDSSLYICLRFRDPGQVRQVIGLGLTLWVDPKGGKKEIFGIRYPLGARSPGGSPPGDGSGAGSPGRPGTPPSGDGGRPGRPPWGDGAGPDSTGRREGPSGRQGDGPRGGQAERFGPALRELEIVGPDKKLDVRRALAGGTGDPGVRVGTLGDSVVVYELRIPLASTSRLMRTLRIEPGALVGLGLRSGRSSSGGNPGGTRPEEPDDPSSGPGSGPGGPGGQGGPGGRGGRTRWQMPSAIDAWIRVQLATEGRTTPVQ